MYLSFVTAAPFKTEHNWINEIKHQQQSQPEVIYETRDVFVTTAHNWINEIKHQQQSQPEVIYET